MEWVYGLGFLALFAASALAGVALRIHLPEEHLSKENMDAVRLVTGLLVTFAALVLSLQLSSARANFDSASRDRSAYAAQLANLDQCLRDLGQASAPTRLKLRQYTAAVIASTWRHETVPLVEGMPDVRGMAVRGEDAGLGRLFATIGREIDAMAPSEPVLDNTAARCRSGFVATAQARWSVIEDPHAPSGFYFIAIVAFWLSLVFLSFGLQVPRRHLAAIVLGLGVVSVASVMFVIVDLGTPYQGVFGIPSTAMRDALVDMSR